MHKKISLAALLLTLLGLAATGCSAASPPGASSASPTNTSAPALVTRDASTDDVALAALMSGKLVLEDTCLRLDNGSVPVFPEDDATWDGTTLTWKGQSYVIGDWIEFGGGEYTEELSRNVVPPECGPGRGWAVAPSRFDAVEQ